MTRNSEIRSRKRTGDEALEESTESSGQTQRDDTSYPPSDALESDSAEIAPPPIRLTNIPVALASSWIRSPHFSLKPHSQRSIKVGVRVIRNTHHVNMTEKCRIYFALLINSIKRLT